MGHIYNVEYRVDGVEYRLIHISLPIYCNHQYNEQALANEILVGELKKR